MKWYYHIAGGHTHVRVFMNGAKCGDLCFRNEEFQEIYAGTLAAPIIEFIDDSTDDAVAVLKPIDETEPPKEAA